MAKRHKPNLVGGVGLVIVGLIAACCGGPIALLGKKQTTEATKGTDFSSTAHTDAATTSVPVGPAPIEIPQAVSPVPTASVQANPDAVIQVPPKPSESPALAPVAETPQPMREWTSGKFKTKATFVALVEDQVRLKKVDGRIVNVPLEKLSFGDRQFIRRAIRTDATANVIIGKVVGVTDGDTITVLDDNFHQYKVRLEGIDAPEFKQDFGSAAKKALSEKVFDKIPWIEWKETDRYGRTLGHVYLDGRHINLEMVADGYAWHYTKYSSDTRLANAELVARSRKVGLWSQPNPIPPWEFRAGAIDVQRDTSLPIGSAAATGDADQVNTSVTVYVTRSGTKYHQGECRHLAKSRIPIDLGQARTKYTPCGTCRPPN